MNFIVVGCGRVGLELALLLTKKHVVTMIDMNPRAFDKLGSSFTGRTIEGEALDRRVLERAGAGIADGLAAVTASDNVNAIVAQIARNVFHIKRVVARLYNPRRASLYKKLDLDTISSASWGAHQIEQLLVYPGLQFVGSAGDGEVRIYEINVIQDWNGRELGQLFPLNKVQPVALIRAGRAVLPRLDMKVQGQDRLQVAATAEGRQILLDYFPETLTSTVKE